MLSARSILLLLRYRYDTQVFLVAVELSGFRLGGVFKTTWRMREYTETYLLSPSAEPPTPLLHSEVTKVSKILLVLHRRATESRLPDLIGSKGKRVYHRGSISDSGKTTTGFLEESAP
jgi:hypothetical protein